MQRSNLNVLKESPSNGYKRSMERIILILQNEKRKRKKEPRRVI